MLTEKQVILVLLSIFVGIVSIILGFLADFDYGVVIGIFLVTYSLLICVTSATIDLALEKEKGEE